jgi:hypothetical protein
MVGRDLIEAMACSLILGFWRRGSNLFLIASR